MFYKSKVTCFISNHTKKPYYNFQFLRTFVDDAEIKFVRDKGLDHAVEREKDLKPMINLKNLLKLEPSNSLPLSLIVENKHKLETPFRPIEFIRKYPSCFEEFLPGNIGIHPHIRLTPKSLDLDAQEQLIFDSDIRKNAADRLLKLLMLCRVNEIPLQLIDKLKWDLGLPDNYVTSLVPEFPDYFQLKKKGLDNFLELVCWSDDLAVSVMEKTAKKSDKDYQKGMPITFPSRFSKGFELDKKLKKWIDEWQKLPYISPYENASHLQPNSDESDKWAVAVLHELMHILVPKKTERDNVLLFGDYLGVKPRLKRAIAHHPDIFYLSSKIGTYTVVLKEVYKRGLLIDKDPLMDMRSKYLHLMHTEVKKAKNKPSVDGKKQKVVEGGVEKENEDNGKEQDEEMQVDENEAGVDDSDADDEDYDSDETEEDEEEVKESSRGRNEKRDSSDTNEGGQRRVGDRSGRGGFNKANEEDRGRGRSGRRGFNKENEGGERGRSVNGRQGFNKVNEVGNERGGRRGFNKVNEEGNERGGRRGFNKVSGEGSERSGSKDDRRGFSKGNWEGKERGGNRTERSGFNRGNGEGNERGGRGFSKGNWEGKETGENRTERSGFNKGDGEGQESGRRGTGKFNAERSRSGHWSGKRETSKVNGEGNARNGGRSGRREPGNFSEGGRSPRRTSKFA